MADPAAGDPHAEEGRPAEGQVEQTDGALHGFAADDVFSGRQRIGRGEGEGDGNRQQQMGEPGFVVEVVDAAAAEMHRIEFPIEKLAEGVERGRLAGESVRRLRQSAHGTIRRFGVQLRHEAETGVGAEMAPAAAEPFGGGAVERIVVAQVGADQVAEFGADQRIAPPGG